MVPPSQPIRGIPPEVAASTVNQRQRFAAAYSVLENAIRERAFPGTAFGMMVGSGVAVLDGLGRFTYVLDAPPVAADTIYDVASLTKVLATTSAAMLLYDRGVLELDRPLGDVLPGFVIGPSPVGGGETPERSSRARCDVTLRMLLAHTSGLPAYARLFETSRNSTELLQACLQVPLNHIPGMVTEYSDIGFILLGKALEVLAGEPLDRFCGREVFAPLGMTSTLYRPPETWRASIPPTEEDTTFRRRILQGEVQDENCFVLGGVSGHAGLFSNVVDTLRYVRCLLSGGRTESGGQIFKPSTLAHFSLRQNSLLQNSRALGWDIPSVDSSSGTHFSPNSIGHLGYAGTSLWIDLDRRAAIVLLTNRTWPDRSSQAIRKVRPHFHDALMKML